MLERRIHVDDSTVHRWVITYSPPLAEAFHRRKRPVWVSGRMDETSIKSKGQWYSLSRAVDNTGQTMDFLLTEQRDEPAAKRLLSKATRRHGVPEKRTIDGSAANAAALKRSNAEHGTALIIRTITYLNKSVAQDHRGVQRVTRPMVGFKSFDTTQGMLAGIARMHMITKRQLVVEEGVEGCTAAALFYSLAALSLRRQGHCPFTTSYATCATSPECRRFMGEGTGRDEGSSPLERAHTLQERDYRCRTDRPLPRTPRAGTSSSTLPWPWAVSWLGPPATHCWPVSASSSSAWAAPSSCGIVSHPSAGQHGDLTPHAPRGLPLPHVRGKVGIKG